MGDRTAIPKGLAPRRRALLGTLGLGVLALLVVAGPAHAADAADATTSAITAGEAVVLGVVEGVTEYLPISSTGHLLITARILDLPDSETAGDAVKSYEIAIQFGAILAVLLLYRHRLLVMAEGLIGRSAEGRKMLAAVVIAFVPAAVVGVISEKVIKDLLFGAWPVVVAWALGGVTVIAMSRRGLLGGRDGRPMEAMTNRDAALVGAAQILALWPGTSRSLVTIVAALLLGLSMGAAVEFSFLLGFLTLSAATAYEILTSGSTMIDSFGVATPLIGLVAAFVAAALSIKWMVGYLSHHDLSIFGWYRLTVAALVVILLVSGAI